MKFPNYKSLSLIISIVTVTFLVACGENGSDQETQDSQSSSQPTSQASADSKRSVATEPAKSSPEKNAKTNAPAVPQPGRVTILYAVIGHVGSANPAGGDRSIEAAGAMAKYLEGLLGNGADGKRIAQEADQSAKSNMGGFGTGTLTFLNFGVAQSVPPTPKTLPRAKQPAVSEAAFNMDINEVRIIPFQEVQNPLGIWVIRRTK